MSFEVKNAGATYQRLADTIFEGQIGRNLEAYVDDMVIKSKMEQDLIQDVEETLNAIKGQVLDDFLADTVAGDDPIYKKVPNSETAPGSEEVPESAKASLQRSRVGAGFILINPEGAKYSYTLRLNYDNSNNDAEYEALLAGLRIATGMKVKNVHAFVDSKLVAAKLKDHMKPEGRKQRITRKKS
ncbi:reverse transcriptase domain-containing protein [Tanacetum coccineum]